MIQYFHDFSPLGDIAREAGLNAPYIDWEGYDGETYKRVCLTDVPGLREALEARVGHVDMLGMGFRLNFGGEEPNAAIHSDLGWGTHALVWYLSDGEGGTGFWRHLATGADRIEAGDVPLWEQVRGDWNDEDKWELWHLAPMAMNSAVVYESAYFHSRYPFKAFGKGYNDGRLIAVAFFNLAGEQ